MNDDADGAPKGAPARTSAFVLRRVSPATAAERLTREEGMARALRNGARPYRDAEGKGRHIPFKEANLAPVEPWVRDPRAKRGYRRTQELRKAAGQLIGQPGDRIEIAKRLGELHWEQGSDIEGAARRGLYDAIWSREHVYDSFTVPRRYGRATLIDTGRIAAVAEEKARKVQAEDPKARGGFWVRDRNDFGLLYVVPNPDPEVPAEETLVAGEGERGVTDMADPSGIKRSVLDTVTEVYDPDSFYDIEEDPEDGGLIIVAHDNDADGFLYLAGGRQPQESQRRKVQQETLDELADGFIAVLEAGSSPDDPLWQQLARLVAEILPGTGHALSAREAYVAFNAAATAIQDGDWEEALLKGGEALLNLAGAVPAIGDLMRLGKGTVKVANLLLRLGRAADVKMTALAATQAARKDARNAAKADKRTEGHAGGSAVATGGRGGKHTPSGAKRASKSGQFLEPVGEGIFGPIFTATGPFSGKLGWEKAVETLRYYKTGEVPAALYHKDIGLIDVVWGQPGTASHDGYGLSKLLRFHPEVEAELPRLIQEMVVVSNSKNRIQLESQNHKAAIRLDWDGTKKRWLLTAFRRK